MADLGNPINDDFLELYSSHYTNGLYDASGLFTDSFDFFDANFSYPQMIDSYFENYNLLWDEFMSNGRYAEAVKLLGSFALTVAWSWERRNAGKLLHKGTPYYFLGVSKIAMDALDEGFLFMHQALQEDIRTYGKKQPPTPAYYFVTLDFSNQNQFFIERVKQTSEYLEKRLDNYRKLGRGTLTLQEFKKRFLEEVDLEESAFYFVVLLQKLLGFSTLEDNMKHNTLASLTETNLLFSLNLVIDAALRNKHPTPQDEGFREFLAFLAQSCTPPLNIADSDLKELSYRFRQDFTRTLNELLNSQYHPRSGITLSPVEEDLGMGLGFRNFGAHRIQYEAEVVGNFDSLLQRTFNTFFFTLEHLYS